MGSYTHGAYFRNQQVPPGLLEQFASNYFFSNLMISNIINHTSNNNNNSNTNGGGNNALNIQIHAMTSNIDQMNTLLRDLQKKTSRHADVLRGASNWNFASNTAVYTYLSLNGVTKKTQMMLDKYRK